MLSSDDVAFLKGGCVDDKKSRFTVVENLHFS